MKIYVVAAVVLLALKLDISMRVPVLSLIATLSGVAGWAWRVARVGVSAAPLSRRVSPSQVVLILALPLCLALGELYDAVALKRAETVRQLLVGKSEAEFYAAHAAQCVMSGLIHSCSFWSGAVRLHAVTGRPETATLIVRQFRESRVEINVASGVREEPIPDN